MSLTAGAIAKLAFEAVIKTGAAKLSEAGLKLAKELWQKIRGKVVTEGLEESTVVELEKKESPEILEKQIVPFLQVAMLKDAQFKQEIQKIAQQINQEIEVGSQDNISMNANAYDEGTVKQVGKIEAKEVQF